MKAREFWLLFAPSFLVMSGLLVIPLIRTIQWSFETVHYGTPGTFVGLDNFVHALTDARFGKAALFTVTVTVITTAILLVLGYIVATGMNRLTLTRPVVLGILLTSYVCPPCGRGGVLLARRRQLRRHPQSPHRVDGRVAGGLAHRAGAARDPHQPTRRGTSRRS